jgi:hypothetical protein
MADLEFETSALWQAAFGERPKDRQAVARAALKRRFLDLREKVAVLVAQIAKDIPALAVVARRARVACRGHRRGCSKSYAKQTWKEHRAVAKVNSFAPPPTNEGNAALWLSLNGSAQECVEPRAN